ncbi:hypothetical protein [Paenibacillus xerothermodurans]|nr:hypothetical protein [Paenibacillus xerothermodurans]
MAPAPDSSYISMAGGIKRCISRECPIAAAEAHSSYIKAKLRTRIKKP